MFDWIPNVLPLRKVLQIWVVGRLQVHGICSHRLVRRKAVETRLKNIRELGMFDNYYTDHKTLKHYYYIIF